MERSENEHVQQEFYSGKNKSHTVKNTILADDQRYVHYLGKTMYGKAHDLTLLKQEVAKDCTFFEKLSIFADVRV